MGENGRSGFAYDGFALDDKWPGLGEGDGDAIEIHHPTVNNLLKALEDELDKLKGNQAGGVEHLRVNTTVSPAHCGLWDVGQHMCGVLNQGQTSVVTSYEKLIAQCEATVVAIRAAIGTTGEAEEASAVGPLTLT